MGLMGGRFARERGFELALALAAPPPDESAVPAGEAGDDPFLAGESATARSDLVPRFVRRRFSTRGFASASPASASSSL
jgi:hypothetical protein